MTATSDAKVTPPSSRFRAMLGSLRRGVGNALLAVRDFVHYSAVKPVPRAEGEKLVEERVWILGIPVKKTRRKREKYRVALLVDEFFGGWDTAIGGYGALARKYICRHIPNEEIEIDLVMDTGGRNTVLHKTVDQTVIYRLPWSRRKRQRWLDQQGYNLFLSIELTEPSYRIISEYKSDTPLLYWVQDPRDLTMYQSRLATVSRLRDDDWGYIRDVSAWMSKAMADKRVLFISQGESLSEIARKMYGIPAETPIEDLPNPVEIDFSYTFNEPAKDGTIIFLGRLEAQKRVWMVCEIAKAMPQYQFCILGATGKGRDEAANARSLEAYRNADGSSKIGNLRFAGHVDGEVKNGLIKKAHLVLNTSIWEGIPISWLEALSFGTLIVSAFERDNIVGRHGTFVGEVMGDGTDEASIRKFAAAIDHWMTDEARRTATARKGIEFVRNRHSIEAFKRNLRGAILRGIR